LTNVPQPKGADYAVLNAFITKSWRPHWDLFRAATTGRMNTHQALASLISPSTNIAALKAKIHTIRDPKTTKLLPGRLTGQLPSNLQVASGNYAALEPIIVPYYSADAVASYSELTLRFYPYFTWLAPDESRLLDVSELQKTASTTQTNIPRSRALLRAAIARSEIAIAQRALLGGDIMIPFVYQRIVSDKGNWEAMKTAADKFGTSLENALKYNPMLTKNLLLYLLREEIRPKDPNLVRYHVALADIPRPEEKGNWLLREIMVNPGIWDIRYAAPESGKPERWCIQLFTQCEPLPNMAELQLGMLQESQEVSTLLGWRDALLEQELGYKIVASLQGNQKRALLAGMLIEASKGSR
jgi:hypothetical protein